MVHDLALSSAGMGMAACLCAALSMDLNSYVMRVVSLLLASGGLVAGFLVMIAPGP